MGTGWVSALPTAGSGEGGGPATPGAPAPIPTRALSKFSLTRKLLTRQSRSARALPSAASSTSAHTHSISPESALREPRAVSAGQPARPPPAAAAPARPPPAAHHPRCAQAGRGVRARGSQGGERAAGAARPLYSPGGEGVALS